MPPEIRPQAEIDAELAEIDQNTKDLSDEGGQSGGETPDPSVAAAEAEAGRRGWVPKDKYKHGDDKWVDAKTFLERGERFNSNLQREVASLKQQLADFEGTKKAFVKFQEELLAKKDGELKDAIAALRVQRSQAIREGDDVLGVELEDRIDLLKDEQRAVKKLPSEATNASDTGNGPKLDDPVLLDWIEEDNQWFKTEPGMRDYALRIGDELVKNGETLRGRKFLDKIRKLMEDEFPRRFAKQQQQGNASAVEGGAGGGSSGSGQLSERDLPAEDRALMREFIAAGYTTKEKFLKSYFSESARKHS